MTSSQPWWQQAVFYRIDVRSFADSDGDAIGDVDGVRSRLGYLELLGVDALVLGGAELSTEADSVAFLIEEAHEAGIRVTIDAPAESAVLRHWLDRGVDGFHLVTIDESASAVVDGYPDRVLVGDGHLEFAAYLTDAGFDAEAIADAIADGLAFVRTVPAWALASWDNGRGGTELRPDHARALALVQLALPGVACLWHGEELGLPGGHRTPMPWEGDSPPYGFSEAAGSWAAIPPEWAARTVEAQLEDPDSTLSLYRRALELRGTYTAGDSIEWFGAPADCFAFQRTDQGLICALNGSSEPVPMPPGTVVISSGTAAADIQAAGELPALTAVWLA